MPEIRKKLVQLLGGEAEAERALRGGEVLTANWEWATGDPLSELKTRGFFTLLAPGVFVNGSCDFTSELLAARPKSYFGWVEHIYHNVDDRVACHPTLGFVLRNLGLRLQALQQSSFFVRQRLHDPHLLAPDVAAQMAAGDDSNSSKCLIAVRSFSRSWFCSSVADGNG